MTEFVAALRTEVDQAQHALNRACEAGDPAATHRHGARLLDLLDRAAIHGVDTTGWVSPAALSLASTVAGDEFVTTPRGRREVPSARSYRPPMCASADAASRLIAVVSDGSAPEVTDHRPAATPLSTWVDRDASVIHERTGVPVRAVPLFACDADDLGVQVRALTADAGVVFLTRTDPDRARRVARILHDAGGPPVLTDADATAIALTAALLTALARAGRTPATGRVVIAGASGLPELGPLLVALGVGDISSWNAIDAHAFPLGLITYQATVLIDLLNAAGDHTTDPDGPTVINPDPDVRLMLVPGLLRGLAGCPGAVWDVDVARAGALALAAAMTGDRPVDDPADRGLVEATASAVLRVLTQRAASGDRDSPPTT